MTTSFSVTANRTLVVTAFVAAAFLLPNILISQAFAKSPSEVTETSEAQFSCLSPDQHTRIDIQLVKPATGASDEVTAKFVSVIRLDSQNHEHEVARFDTKEGLLNNSDSQLVMYFESPAQSLSFSSELGLEAMHSILLDLNDVADKPLDGPNRTVPAQVVFMLNNGATLAQDFSCHALGN
jgi:hypothetical protein